MNGPKDEPEIEDYDGPAGGYGSLESVGRYLISEQVPDAIVTLGHQNKPDGFMCVSCAWAKPAEPQPFEYCENGAKATVWEVTRKRTDQAFFETHTMAELADCRDHDLEEAGRLTMPMRWDPETDKYRPVTWRAAFDEIGAELAALQDDPDQTIFYASGRASLEASYMFQLLARLYGTNNLPDSSNMCHESTSVALPESIGVSVGTVTLQDFETTELMIYLGHNVATNAPRMLHQFQDAKKRGASIISINPLRERGLERFTDPQSPKQMLTLGETVISDTILQVAVGGDIAALTGICKALVDMDDACERVGKAGPTDREALLAETEDDGGFSIKAGAAAATSRRVLDHDFIAEHTQGFAAFADYCRAADWAEIEQVSRLSRAELEAVATQYAAVDKVMGIYGMGLTQHVHGTETVQMLVNLLLLRGNIGKSGAGICPVRGHSNVQGQRTVGITEKPELAPLDRLKELYDFEPPRHEGYTTVTGCEAMIDGKVKAFIALGGNFTRAVPDIPRVEAAWQKLRLTVAIATKLNRSHVVHGEVSYLLPCLGRIEIDQQATGPQAVSIESSLAQFHGSKGRVTPASPDLLSEPAIIANIAVAALPENPKVPWREWTEDYSKIRKAIEKTWPATFEGLDAGMFTPGGITRPVAARERKWNTRSGKANFLVPTGMFAGTTENYGGEGVLQLTTVRSNDQFNTTIYGYHDRFRGVKGTRMVVFMNAADIAAQGFADEQLVDLTTAIDDGHHRVVRGLQIVPYDIPRGSCAAYFPETTPLVPLQHHDLHAHTPAYKAIPVRISASTMVKERAE
ncbi:FdhF/YdeP family oxidoreductase [Polymorphobacter fuscus]|uniref:FdhF/YdeP family oxidoreductase n=1 Tax=Sandarakinorhabdus fusca TaxID=1439888 RepID=A0A7C9GVP6_9SPHN|nr:FdhF/YdeP family oxidoreductase [Polymorphobacter fuscus]KAB7646255.1 FdhF/YdeP family oxidoreductase [Polymorphobacter fuscus]MQT17469.1 FdhF/YdeP family oxidoreductase [Polymorphobacter fuscus]NJC09994.1 molybdopterin-dependent oxidoreductase alpha subunit [Polymorphobacter fuscus]